MIETLTDRRIYRRKEVPSSRAIHRFLGITDSYEFEDLYRSFLPSCLQLSKAHWGREHEIIKSFVWFGINVSGIHFLPLEHYERIAPDLHTSKTWQYFWILYYNRISPSIIDNWSLYERCRTLIDRIIGKDWPAYPFSEQGLHTMIDANGHFNYLGYSIGMLLVEFLLGYTFARAIDWLELAENVLPLIETYRQGHYLKHINDNSTVLVLCSQLPE